MTTETVNGTLYWVIDVDLYPNSPALTTNPDGSYTFNLTLRAPNPEHDVQGAASFTGGAVTIVDPPTNSQELDYTNNVAITSVDVPVNIGVVETKTVDIVFSPVTEGDRTPAPITLSPATESALTANNEKVTQTELTFSGDFGDSTPGEQVGTVIYDGKAYPVTVSAAGTATVTVPFGTAGYDPSKGLSIIWATVATDGDGNVEYDGNDLPEIAQWNHTGSDMAVTSTSTVVDKASNATATAGGESDVQFNATATGPEIVTPYPPAGAVGADSQVSFTVNAVFPDADGSEEHYILVEKKDGWTGDYQTMEFDNRTYFMVPVRATDPNPTVTVNLRTPETVSGDTTESLSVLGLSYEGSTGAITNGGFVSIPIGVVTATGVAMTPVSMDEDGAPQPLTFTLNDNGGNDTLASLTITDLAGGTIVGAGGEVLFSSAPAVLDVATALGGGYFYKPAPYASGDMTIGYTAVVRDPDSNASSSFNQSGTASVTPVANAPHDFTAADQAPVESNHTMLFTVNLAATFDDNDGSEEHFFLVGLPAGTPPPAGWTQVADPDLLAEAGLSGTVYRVEASNEGTASATLTLPPGFTGNDITFKAGSMETANSEYALGSPESVTVPSTPSVINNAPVAQNAAAAIAGIEADPDGRTATGRLTMSDADGDTVAVSGLNSTNDTGGPDGNGNYTVTGLYGTLVIDMATGDFTYTLTGTPAGDATDQFTVTFGDGQGGTGTATIAVNLYEDQPPVTTRAMPLAEDSLEWLAAGTEWAEDEDAGEWLDTDNLLGSLEDEAAPSWEAHLAAEGLTDPEAGWEEGPRAFTDPSGILAGMPVAETLPALTLAEGAAETDAVLSALLRTEAVPADGQTVLPSVDGTPPTEASFPDMTAALFDEALQNCRILLEAGG